MIVDVHSHAWPSPQVFSAKFLEEAYRMRSRPVAPRPSTISLIDPRG